MDVVPEAPTVETDENEGCVKEEEEESNHVHESPAETCSFSSSSLSSNTENNDKPLESQQQREEENKEGSHYKPFSQLRPTSLLDSNNDNSAQSSREELSPPAPSPSLLDRTNDSSNSDTSESEMDPKQLVEHKRNVTRNYLLNNGNNNTHNSSNSSNSARPGTAEHLRYSSAQPNRRYLKSSRPLLGNNSSRSSETYGSARSSSFRLSNARLNSNVILNSHEREVENEQRQLNNSDIMNTESSMNGRVESSVHTNNITRNECISIPEESLAPSEDHTNFPINHINVRERSDNSISLPQASLYSENDIEECTPVAQGVLVGDRRSSLARFMSRRSLIFDGQVVDSFTQNVKERYSEYSTKEGIKRCLFIFLGVISLIGLIFGCISLGRTFSNKGPPPKDQLCDPKCNSPQETCGRDIVGSKIFHSCCESTFIVNGMPYCANTKYLGEECPTKLDAECRSDHVCAKSKRNKNFYLCIDSSEFAASSSLVSQELPKEEEEEEEKQEDINNESESEDQNVEIILPEINTAKLGESCTPTKNDCIQGLKCGIDINNYYICCAQLFYSWSSTGVAQAYCKGTKTEGEPCFSGNDLECEREYNCVDNTCEYVGSSSSAQLAPEDNGENPPNDEDVGDGDGDETLLDDLDPLVSDKNTSSADMSNDTMVDDTEIDETDNSNVDDPETDIFDQFFNDDSTETIIGDLPEVPPTIACNPEENTVNNTNPACVLNNVTLTCAMSHHDKNFQCCANTFVHDNNQQYCQKQIQEECTTQQDKECEGDVECLYLEQFDGHYCGVPPENTGTQQQPQGPQVQDPENSQTLQLLEDILTYLEAFPIASITETLLSILSSIPLVSMFVPQELFNVTVPSMNCTNSSSVSQGT